MGYFCVFLITLRYFRVVWGISGYFEVILRKIQKFSQTSFLTVRKKLRVKVCRPESWEFLGLWSFPKNYCLSTKSKEHLKSPFFFSLQKSNFFFVKILKFVHKFQEEFRQFVQKNWKPPQKNIWKSESFWNTRHFKKNSKTFAKSRFPQKPSNFPQKSTK